MNTPEHNHAADYTPREVEAARRVLIELGQVLGGYREAIVLVGGWVPELRLPKTRPPHIGSIDADLLLDPSKLRDQRYAALLETMERSGYRPGEKSFQLFKEIKVDDGSPIRVDVEFLIPAGFKPGKRTKIRKGFRALDVNAGEFAIANSDRLSTEGRMPDGRKNKIEISVTSIEAFLVMKCFALAGRDKPKDVYDIYFCLLNFPGGVAKLADKLRLHLARSEVRKGLRLLSEKFRDPDDYGPQSVIKFLNSSDPEERSRQARDSYERVALLLRLLSL